VHEEWWNGLEVHIPGWKLPAYECLVTSFFVICIDPKFVEAPLDDPGPWFWTLAGAVGADELIVDVEPIVIVTLDFELIFTTAGYVNPASSSQRTLFWQ